jgi:NIPSNAP.
MISQIRIYTINKGEMDNFLKHFKDEIMVLHQKIGVPIVGTWVNRPQNEFIWVRTYKDKASSKRRPKSSKPRSRPPESNLEPTLRRWKCARPNRPSRRSGLTALAGARAIAYS